MEKVKILERLNTLEEEMRSMKREVATNSGPQKDYSFNEPSMFYDEYPEYSPVVPPTQYTPQSQLFQTPPDPRYPPMSTTISPSVGSTPPASTPPAPCYTAVKPSKTTHAPLPSTEINKALLRPVDDVLSRYQKFKCESKIGTLAVKLAREVFFGEEVMVKCTVVGCRNLPALPSLELSQLKDILFKQFPAYWRNPMGFEHLWATCICSINQCCKMLRQNAKN